MHYMGRIQYRPCYVPVQKWMSLNIGIKQDLQKEQVVQEGLQ